MEKVKEKLARLREEGKFLRREIQNQTISYTVAALGLIAGLAWNDAIRSFIEYVFPATKNTLLAKFIYALLITVAIVLLTVYIVKIFGRKNDKN